MLEKKVSGAETKSLGDAKQVYVSPCPQGLPKCFEDKCKLSYACEVYDGGRK